MAAVQTSYAESIGVGVPGMPANMEKRSPLTRTASGNIAFGLPVIRVGDHNCALATVETYQAAAIADPNNAPAGATITAAPTVSAGAKLGVYKATCVVGGSATASKWRIEDPDGVYVGTATGNTAFTGGGLAFTITDSGTDPLPGESFNITTTATVLTDVLDVLGIALFDRTLVHTTADRYEQYDNVKIAADGVIWVTCGATVAAGDEAYWDPATSKWTNDTTKLRMPGWKFDQAGVDTNIVKVARR